MLVENSNRRTFPVDRHAGVVSGEMGKVGYVVLWASLHAVAAAPLRQLCGAESSGGLLPDTLSACAF